MILSVALALRVTLAGNPLAGAGPWLSLVVGAFGAYTLLTLLSQIWSHAPGDALEEFDRSLVYLLVLVLSGSIAHKRERFAWMLRGLAAAIVIVCACALITRLLPHLWPTAVEFANSRLSFPLTYWNAFGIFDAFGAVLCLHFTSDPREALATRVIAAAALPVVATTGVLHVLARRNRGGVYRVIV